MNHKEAIQTAVERTAGAPASFVESQPIVETFRGQVVWEGVVGVFTIQTDPPFTAYGWAINGAKEPQYVAVLGKPPIDNALSAVRAWIVSQSRK